MTALELIDALEQRGVLWRVTSVAVEGVTVQLMPSAPTLPAEKPDVRTNEDAKIEERELIESMYAAGAGGFIPSVGDG